MQAIAPQSLSAGRAKAPAPCPARHISSRAACSSSETSSRPVQRRRTQGSPAPAAAPRRPLEIDYDEDHGGVDAYGEPIEENEISLLSKDVYLDEVPDAIEGKAGYTPYDFIDFTDLCLKHELVAKVDKPVSEVYALWADRLNWPYWFTMIEEVGFKEGDPDVCALNMWYRWAATPWLELYVALRRTRAEPNKYIVEEPEDGAPLVAAALFQEADGGAATLVTLRVSYLLPRVLFEFAGQMAVYGDVDRKLAACMERMKEWVEGVDTAEVLAAQAAAMADMREGLPEHMRQQQEYDKQWEAEKQRRRQERQQQAAAAAAAQTAADSEAAAARLVASAAPRDAAADAAAPAPRARRGRKPAGSATVTNPMAKSKRGRKASGDAAQ